LISEKQGDDELERQNELPHTGTIQEKTYNLLPDNGETLGGEPTEGESQHEPIHTLVDKPDTMSTSSMTETGKSNMETDTFWNSLRRKPIEREIMVALWQSAAQSDILQKQQNSASRPPTCFHTNTSKHRNTRSATAMHKQEEPCMQVRKTYTCWHAMTNKCVGSQLRCTVTPTNAQLITNFELQAQFEHNKTEKQHAAKNASSARFTRRHCMKHARAKRHASKQRENVWT
jgi:hypothetical protein